MKSLQHIIYTLMFFLVLGSSCIRDKYPVNYQYGEFPDSVMNLESVNSIYDDYNSAGPPTINLRFPLIFSTNRYTKGETFDLIDFDMYIYFDQYDGSFEITGQPYSYPFYNLTDLANGNEDEFGPINGVFSQSEYLFCFASNRTGNMEIFVSYWDNQTFGGVSMNDPTPFRLQGVNSPSYDAYPSFTADFSKMILSSNRDGELDFYTIDIPSENRDIMTWLRLTDTTFVATPVEELNSPARDVCPFINGNVIVFASDREGTFGGYDLWYARLTADGFSEPVNFGPEINSEYDEFRPIVIYAEVFSNDLLIFSSDRPGGKGGFDLYCTGIERMTVN
jgi:hypothetical protein